jgi:putative membrane protein
MDEMAWRSMHAASKLLVNRRLDLTVDGREFIPPTGPAIIAARHYHHLYDGCVLLSVIPRPTSILVTLDWVKQPLGKRVMESLCRAARWPIVPRRDQGERNDGRAGRGLHKAIRQSLALMEEERVLVVCPEAYPNIDPGYTPKGDADSFLPFEPGFVRLASMAASRGLAAPIIPAGFRYCQKTRWRVHLAFGEPVFVSGAGDLERARKEIEARVHRLSSTET